MGVMECDRKGCTNVMCDYYSSELDRYICGECLKECKEYFADHSEIYYGDMEEFFETERKYFSPPKENVMDFFEDT